MVQNILIITFFLGYTVRVKAKLKTNSNRRACAGETKVEINVVENCDLLNKEICFWNSATYQLYENQKPRTIGSLTSPYFVDVCEEYNISYTVLNGKSKLFLIYHIIDNNCSICITNY